MTDTLSPSLVASWLQVAAGESSLVSFVLNLEKGHSDVIGKHRGPFQFDKVTWDALDTGSIKYSWSSNVNSRDISTLFFNRLISSNKGIHIAWSTAPFTNEIAYLYHNQGASAAREYLETGKLVFPKQSRDALNTFAQARNIFQSSLS